MVEQVAGAATASIIVLAYAVVLEAMTAIVVLLGQFLILQVRNLRSLIRTPHNRPIPAGPAKPYRLGGGLMRW